jgi:hypothetical protein
MWQFVLCLERHHKNGAGCSGTLFRLNWDKTSCCALKSNLGLMLFNNIICMSRWFAANFDTIRIDRVRFHRVRFHRVRFHHLCSSIVYRFTKCYNVTHQVINRPVTIHFVQYENNVSSCNMAELKK